MLNKKVNYLTYYAGEDDLHPKIKDVFKWYNEFLDQCISATYRSEVILAGGALRSFFTATPVRDYDIYVTTNCLDYNNVLHPDFFQAGKPWKKVCETRTSFIYRTLEYDPLEQELRNYTINVIRQTRQKIESVIDDYDFTVCMCGINDQMITLHPDYFVDLTTRQIRIHNPGDPLSTLWRLQKYIKLGYTIDREELWKIAEDIHEVDSLPVIVADEEEKVRHSLKEDVKTLEEIFRSS